jgi:CheY-like chemotaxis protein
MAQTVLVADDSIASQRLFEMVLTREGYNVVTVGSGAEVLERVKEKHPDIALVDAIMPEVDGYQISINPLNRMLLYQRLKSS